MAHFAQIDENSVVIRVVVVSNEKILDDSGNESEALGIELCRATCGGGEWVQTSYTHTKRRKYAGIGDIYVRSINAFIPPKPFTSWVLDESSGSWKPPIEAPGGNCQWNEALQNWETIPLDIGQGERMQGLTETSERSKTDGDKGKRIP